jgi:LemA protein
MGTTGMTMFIVAGAAAVAGVYLVNIYNGLVRLKHNIDRNWADIDVLLKQRHDELPKLVEVCKQHAGFEQATLEKVMQARAAVGQARQSGDMAALGAAEAQLRVGLTGLYAVAEKYPELKAHDSFKNLQVRITQLENAVSDRRELYNDSVNLNNIRVETFPDAVIARSFGFKPAALLAFDRSETADVNVKDLFKA